MSGPPGPKPPAKPRAAGRYVSGLVQSPGLCPRDRPCRSPGLRPLHSAPRLALWAASDLRPASQASPLHSAHGVIFNQQNQYSCRDAINGYANEPTVSHFFLFPFPFILKPQESSVYSKTHLIFYKKS